MVVEFILQSLSILLIASNNTQHISLNNTMEPKTFFSSCTLMGKEQVKKVHQLIQSLIDSPDSFEFRSPVDYVTFGLLDYPLIVKKPMDLSTVKKHMSNNMYETVESCLADIQLIWDNCKLYNTPQNWIYKQADKLQKMTKKMIRNYVPFVKIQNPTDRRRGPHKKQVQVVGKKANLKVPQPEPKDYLEKKEQVEKQQEVLIQSEYSKQRKQFLMFVTLCTPDQVGVIFLLLRKHSPEALEFDEEGKVKVNMEGVSDTLLRRLLDQLDMWGIGYAPIKKR